MRRAPEALERNPTGRGANNPPEKETNCDHSSYVTKREYMDDVVEESKKWHLDAIGISPASW